MAKSRCRHKNSKFACAICGSVFLSEEMDDNEALDYADLLLNLFPHLAAKLNSESIRGVDVNSLVALPIDC